MDLIASLKNAITCTICLDVYQDPVTFGTCRHSFCKQCALGLVEFRDSCPLCAVKFNKSNITSLHALNRIISATQSLVHEALLLNDPKYHSSLATSSSSSTKPTTSLVQFHEGDLVEVQARTWAGINKPGGTARILSFSVDEGSYEVKYVLTGAKEKGILPLYISQLNLESLPTNRRRTRVEGSLQEQSEGLSIDGPDGTREKTIKDSSNKAKKRKPVTSSSATMTPSTFHRPIVLLTSGLDDEDSQQLVAKFVHTFPHAAVTMAIEPTASIPVLGSSAQPTEAKAEDINADVESVATHLVVSVDRHNVFPHRTIKYLQALIAGLWVVNSDWLAQSVRRGAVQREEEFEVTSCSKAVMPNAPRRARLDRSVNTSFRGLFRDVVALVHGQFPMPLPQRSKLTYLLRGGRARLCDSIDAFVTACVKAHSGGVLNSSTHPTYKVVLCSDTASANQFIDELTELTSGDPLRFPKNFLKRYHIHVVSTVWLLDCVANYNFIKPDSGSGQYDILT